MTTVTKKTVKRRPIRFTKSGKRLLSGRLRLGLAGTKHHGPMRRLERSTALLQSSRNCFRGSRASRTGRDFARIKSRRRFLVLTARLFRQEYSRQPWSYSASLAGMRSRLVKAKNVWVACGDLAQVNIARRDIRIVATTRRPLPLLSCDCAEAQQSKYYRHSQCHDRFGREFHFAIMCFAATP